MYVHARARAWCFRKLFISFAVPTVKVARLRHDDGVYDLHTYI